MEISIISTIRVELWVIVEIVEIVENAWNFGARSRMVDERRRRCAPGS